MSEFADRRRVAWNDASLYLVGVVGLAACLTLVFLSMRAVMNIGGFCADGGPYVIETACPDGVPLLLTGGIFGLFGFGGLMLWKGVALGGPYAALTALAWPALFISLGWNFLEYAFNPPGPAGQGIVWGWLIPGVIFVLMGGVPLAVAVWPGGSARTTLGSGGRRTARHADVARARLLGDLVQLRAKRSADAGGADDDLVDKLERLAALRRSGDLDDLEFEQAKRALLRAE